MDLRNQNTKATNFLKNSIITIVGLILAGTGLWALMFYSVSSNNLESYASYKKSQKIFESKVDNPKVDKLKKSESQEISRPPKPNLGNLIKAATSTSSSKTALPRETLEHIKKGMEFTEKGKYNAGNKEFEKAALLSPESADLYSIWGAALRMAKKFKGANKRFARAHELSPNDSEITLNLSLIHI